MGIEEKAKAYDEALKRAEAAIDIAADKDLVKGVATTIFPELAKSEDERLRKLLVWQVHRNIEDETNDLKGSVYDGIKGHDPDLEESIEDWKKCLAYLEKQKEPEDKGEISDGYHTFNELYYYRMLYNAAFFNLLPKEWVHKSKRHHDSEKCFGGGWFIVMANLPTGQVSNHYELKDWDLFQIPEKEIADEWDGHTPQEAAERIHKYLLEKQKEQKPASTEDVYIADEHFYEQEPVDSFKYKLAEYMTKNYRKVEGPYGHTYAISAESILQMAKEELIRRGELKEQKPVMIQWTGKNLKEVIDFTSKSPKFGEWFKSWEDFENYVHSHDDILKLFCEDGSHYEVPVGAWIVKTPDGYNIPSRFRFIQKSAEWSEEDEERLYKIAEFLAYHGYKDDADFIDSIRDKREMNPPKINGNSIPTDTKSVDIQSHTWSEEDEETLEKLHRLLVICRGEKKFIQEADYNKMDNLLKHLRPSWKPSEVCYGAKGDPDPAGVWKPSEEQMLKEAVEAKVVGFDILNRTILLTNIPTDLNMDDKVRIIVLKEEEE